MIRIAGTTIPGRSIVCHQGGLVMAVTPSCRPTASRTSGGTSRQSTPIQKPVPTRIKDTAIIDRSIVSHQGALVEGSVFMAVTPHPYLGEKQRKECELVHNH